MDEAQLAHRERNWLVAVVLLLVALLAADQAHPSRALVAVRVKNGKGGMPSFAGHLTPEQIANVADYVSSVAGN